MRSCVLKASMVDCPLVLSIGLQSTSWSTINRHLHRYLVNTRSISQLTVGWELTNIGRQVTEYQLIHKSQSTLCQLSTDGWSGVDWQVDWVMIYLYCHWFCIIHLASQLWQVHHAVILCCLALWWWISCWHGYSSGIKKKLTTIIADKQVVQKQASSTTFIKGCWCLVEQWINLTT